jgi:methyltransferase (TIGR00027 family)
VKRVQAIFGELPTHVTYVPVDFNTQTLEQRLLECGYNSGIKTLFIWQGVTEYLLPEAVHTTLAFVRRNSAPGSAIVFDYLYSEALDKVQKHAEINNMRRYRFITGEGLTFGIPESGVAAFLEERGFCQVRDINAEDLYKRYFVGPNAKRKVAVGYGIAIGEV